MLAHSPAASRSRRAQTTRPPSVVVSTPQPSGPVRAHHVQAVRAAVGLPAAPGATEVFGLDPDMIRVQFGADDEVLGPAPGVQDGVGGEFGRDEHRVGGGRAPCQVPGYRMADVAHLVGSPG